MSFRNWLNSPSGWIFWVAVSATVVIVGFDLFRMVARARSPDKLRVPAGIASIVVISLWVTFLMALFLG